MAQRIDGREIARHLQSQARARLDELARDGRIPTLVSVQVGDDAASELYVRRQARTFERAGVPFRRDRLPAEARESDLLALLKRRSADPEVAGIMLQLPLPEHMDARRMRLAIDPRKDVEGIHPQNLGHLLSGVAHLAPCTAGAALECLLATGVALEGREAVVVGHSETVGKPMALLLMERLATVTTCHHATRDLAAHTRAADIVVVAVGKAGLITVDMVKEGAILIDIGINETVDAEGRRHIVGDVAPEATAKAAHYTPVPGGVGPVTVQMLLRNVLRTVN